MLDLVKARRETPGCNYVVHLNNAGAALMPEVVLDTVTQHLVLEGRLGGYEAARLQEMRLEAVYTSAATLLHAAPDEIAIVENATRAWDMAFYGIPFRSGERILTSQTEYASNLIAYLQIAKRKDVVVEVIPNDAYGQVSVEALAAMMDERVRLVAITHIPTNGGLINPAEEIGRIVKPWEALYLLDACQSVGQLPVDVEAIGCDMLSATSRKYLRGPRGMGLLYVRGTVLEQLEPPFLDLHAAELVAPDRYELLPSARRFENWECNIAAKLGFGAAIDYALDWGVRATWSRIQQLAETLRSELIAIPGVRVHDLGYERCGIVSFTVEGWKADALQQVLLEQSINVNRSRASSTLLDMRARGLDELVRASLHYYNSEDESERFLETVAALAREVIA